MKASFLLLVQLCVHGMPLESVFGPLLFTINIPPHRRHCSADDTHLFLSSKPSTQLPPLPLSTTCMKLQSTQTQPHKKGWWSPFKCGRMSHHDHTHPILMSIQSWRHCGHHSVTPGAHQKHHHVRLLPPQKLLKSLVLIVWLCDWDTHPLIHHLKTKGILYGPARPWTGYMSRTQLQGSWPAQSFGNHPALFLTNSSLLALIPQYLSNLFHPFFQSRSLQPLEMAEPG